jgi:ABC-type multidrug transport system ATPase subunit
VTQVDGAAPAPVVQAVDVVKHWGSTLALAGATMEIPPGVTGLLGANGSGKTHQSTTRCRRT